MHEYWTIKVGQNDTTWPQQENVGYLILTIQCFQQNDSIECWICQNLQI